MFMSINNFKMKADVKKYSNMIFFLMNTLNVQYYSVYVFCVSGHCLIVHIPGIKAIKSCSLAKSQQVINEVFFHSNYCVC